MGRIIEWTVGSSLSGLPRRSLWHRALALHNAPTDPFVADFIGTSSFVEGRLVEARSDGTATVQFGNGQHLRVGLCRCKEPGASVIVAIRPERVSVSGTSSPATADGSLVAAEVRARSFLGPRYQYEIATCGA